MWQRIRQLDIPLSWTSALGFAALRCSQGLEQRCARDRQFPEQSAKGKCRIVLYHFGVVHAGDAGKLGFEMRNRAQVRLVRVEIIESPAEQGEQLGFVMVAFGAKLDQFHEISRYLGTQISSANAGKRIPQSQFG